MGMRRVTEELQMKVVLNTADDWSNRVDITRLAEMRVRGLVEERDPETGAYKMTTVKHALLNRFTMD